MLSIRTFTDPNGTGPKLFRLVRVYCIDLVRRELLRGWIFVVY